MFVLRALVPVMWLLRSGQRRLDLAKDLLLVVSKGATVLSHSAIFYQPQVFANCLQEELVVRHHQHAALERFDRLDERCHGLRVEVVGGLILGGGKRAVSEASRHRRTEQRTRTSK